MWGMGDHSRPLHTFEETVHIPLIFRHTGRIPPGTVFSGRTCTYDLFSSLLDYLDMAGRIPHSPSRPGRSFARALQGEDIGWEDAIFFEYENTRMVRGDRWKYTWRHPDGPDELYDMEDDPGERRNLAEDAAHSAVVRDLRARIEEFFNRYADPQYDLWRGGRSKAGRAIAH
jgi:arylsulfatase A-like enzyme